MLGQIDDQIVLQSNVFLLAPTQQKVQTSHKELKVEIKFDAPTRDPVLEVVSENLLTISLSSEPAPSGFFIELPNIATMDDGSRMTILIVMFTFGIDKLARRVEIQWSELRRDV